MRIRFWNAIKRRRRKSKRCRQKWFNHGACREMFPVSIQFAILLTIRFRKSKFNFPEKHFTSSLWRSPGIDSAVTSSIMRCPGLQIVAVAVHAGATEKATKAEKSCWMNWNLVWNNWFVGEFWIHRWIKKFRGSNLRQLSQWQCVRMTTFQIFSRLDINLKAVC